MCPGLAPQELVPEGLRPESGWGEGGSIASLQGPASPGGRGGGLEHQRSSQGNGRSMVVVGRGESSVQLAAAALVGSSVEVRGQGQVSWPWQAWGTPAPHLPPTSLISGHLSLAAVSPADDPWASVPDPFVPGRCPQPPSAPSWGLSGHQAWAWL